MSVVSVPPAERDINQIKYEVETRELHQLSEVNPVENEFWDRLRRNCLLPDSVAFAHDQDLKG